MIYSHDSVKWALTCGKASYDYAPVQVGDCCYIGSQTVINKGVVIGPYSIIGAGSFVNRNIPHHSIAAGSPAKIVGRVRCLKNGKVELLYK